MPLFSYVCRDCNETAEILVRGSETPVCPKCGSTSLDKQMSAFAPVSGTSRGSEPAPCGAAGGCCSGGSCPYS